MTEIIPFPARPLRVVSDDKPATTVSERLTALRSFILAMGPEADPLQAKRDFEVRQGKILETWVDESVAEIGSTVVIEMLESMVLHLRNDKR